MPYQSTVVSAVLVGQVSNGGCDAGTEQLLSLVKIALVDFIEKLIVSAHITRQTSQFRTLGKTHLQGGSNGAVALFRKKTIVLTLESSPLAARSVQSVTGWKEF